MVRNLSAFTTLFAPGKSWDNVRSTAAPYTESRLTHLVRNKCVGFPVVEQNQTFILHYHQPFICSAGQESLVLYLHDHTVKKVTDFPVLSRDFIYQTLTGRDLLNYSRPGRVWLVTSWLGTGKSVTFFAVQLLTLLTLLTLGYRLNLSPL
jgi:hypothetical protein